ncbi:MAG: thioester reductase domain-containing protein, partial [Planctomycetota bacterium]|nr:thioester reductase domain-containing protein [Planctomycetota bacterium]
LKDVGNRQLRLAGNAALLGCWLAGRAWLALDLDQPIERRRRLAAGSGAVAAFATERSLATDLGLVWLPSPAATDHPAGEPGRARGELATPDTAPIDEAFRVATSGSTGEPKWIAMGHGALAARIAGAQATYGWGPGHVVLHRIPLSFDAALLELLLPLLLGARVVLAEDDRDPAAVLELAARESVTTLVGLASWLEVLLERRADLAGCGALSQLISGGEPIGPGFRRALGRLAVAPAVFNSYGPAEACIEATCRRLAGGELDPSSPPPSIGTALPGTRAWVVDDRGRPVPLGVEGELVLAGAGLALGYVGDAATGGFRQGPSGERCYFTGDRARQRGDGALLFSGRADRQLKLSGLRFDASEVEAALGEHPAVAAAAVRQQGGLVAHLVLRQQVPASSLVAHARQLLPRPMRPSAWRVHAELPTLPSGKVDLQRLGTGEFAGEPLAMAAREPAPGLETRLVPLVLAQLPVHAASADRARPRTLDPEADFFALGGSSLGAIRLLAAVAQELGREVPLAEFFRAPTLAHLAAWLAEGDASRAHADRQRVAATWERMRADARLAPSTGPPSDPNFGPPAAPSTRPGDPNSPGSPTKSAVLLTGATGFLGAFLLVELLEAQPGEVRCLVRAKTAEEARARVERNLASFGLNLATDARVHFVPGDLSRPQLGLGAEERASLGAGLGRIVHSAAVVDFFRDYEALRGANVEGTRCLLELAWEAGARFDLVSTIGVLVGAKSPARPRDERTPLAELDDLEGGYEQSKWVAEALTLEAARRGLQVAIHRPGRVAPSAGRCPGAGSSADFAGRFLLGCLELGSAPDLDAPIDLVPVDHVARAVVHLGPGCHHLLHPEPTPYRRLLEAARSRGHQLDFVDLETWRARLADSERLAPVAALLQGLDGPGAERALTPDRALAGIDSTASHAELRRLGIEVPAVDAAWCDAVIRHLEQRGELRLPQAP